MSNAPVQPFIVGEVVLTSLDALTSAAALHLGEALPDGRKLDAPDPQEAWLAILAASGLMNHVGPLMKEGPREAFGGRIEALAKRFGERHPHAEFPVPSAIADALAGPAKR